MVRRRLLLAGLAVAGLGAACATEDTATPVRRPPTRDGVLTPWLTITGGWRLPSSLPLPVPAVPAQPLAPAARLNLLQPVGVAARGDVLVIADAGAGTLWRYDRTRDAMVALAPYAGHSGEQGVSMQIDADYSVWVALPAEHAIVQFDARGRLLRRLRDDVNVTRPVALALRPERQEILVADSGSSAVVAFDRFGKAFRFHQSGETPLQSVVAMDWGPGGLYVLDRIAQQVVVLGERGEVVGLVGDEHLVHPRAMAVDRAGRVFIADEADQRIKVFRGREMIASHGGPQYGRIEALALDANLLYVADSINARVHVLLVAPPSLERPATP